MNLRRLGLEARLRVCGLCTRRVPETMSEKSCESEFLVEDEHIVSSTTVPRKKPICTRGHLIKIAKFFNASEHLLPYKEYIPRKYIEKKTQNPPEVMYLMCSKIATSVVAHVMPVISSQGNQIVAETSPGLGLITKELLSQGIKTVRMYESCSDFHYSIKELHKQYLDRLELFSKDIFNLHKYAYMDRQDHGNRVMSLLQGVPKKNWSADPVITIIGGMPSLGFLRFLIRSLAIQNEVTTYGRIQIFALMRPADFAVMSAKPNESALAYKYWSILLQLFLDFEILDKYERKYFIPWTFDTVNTDRYPLNLDPDLLYLVKISFKSALPMQAEDSLHFFHFVKQFYGRGNKMLIPIIEKWVPNCGLNIISPKLQHEDYFEDISIFTKFNELTPKQILGVFNEVKNFPTYKKSPFTAMVENELMASETVETDVHDEFEKKVKRDLRYKMNDGIKE